MKIVLKALVAACAAGLSFLCSKNALASAVAFAVMYAALSFQTIYILPRKTVSFIVGKLMRIPLGPLRVPAIKLYIKLTGVDMATVEEPLSAFKSLQAFFNRQLDLTKRGFKIENKRWRLEKADASTVYAPADSKLAHYGYISKDNKARVKGAQFTLEQLVLDTEHSDNVFFAVFYLSPADYHNFHCPFDFSVSKVAHVHGDHWPVNDTFMPRIDALLAKNERAVLSGSWGASKAWYVPVGALNVASIVMDDFQLLKGKQFAARANYAPGAQMGRFQFGSTVVVLFEVPKGRQVNILKDGKVKTGEAVLKIE